MSLFLVYFQGIHSHRLEAADGTTVGVNLAGKLTVRSFLVILQLAQVLVVGITICTREVSRPSCSPRASDRWVHVVSFQQMGSQTIFSGELSAADDTGDELSDVETHFLQVLLEVSQVSVALDGVESCGSEGTMPAIEVSVLLSLLSVDLGLMLH